MQHLLSLSHDALLGICEFVIGQKVFWQQGNTLWHHLIFFVSWVWKSANPTLYFLITVLFLEAPIEVVTQRTTIL